MARNSPQSEGTLQHKIAGGRVGREYINIL